MGTKNCEKQGPPLKLKTNKNYIFAQIRKNIMIMIFKIRIINFSISP